MKVTSWTVRTPGERLLEDSRDETCGDADVLVEVAGCGVCHTDIGFYAGDVPTRHPLPLTLGHEVSGVVVEAGPGAEAWVGKSVIVPAVLPCGECSACQRGLGSICPEQIFPGNDVHGGFGTHVRVPSRGLCEVSDLSDRLRNPTGIELSTLSVIADAVTTPLSGSAAQSTDKGRPCGLRGCWRSGWVRRADCCGSGSHCCSPLTSIVSAWNA